MSTVNANRPKGQLSDDQHSAWAIHDTDQIKQAEQYRPLIVAYNNGCAGAVERRQREWRIRSRTSATLACANGKPAVLVIVFRQPGANIIETVDRRARQRCRCCRRRSIRLSIT